MDLPTSIGKLTELRSLDVSNNNLDFFPGEIGNLINLKKFNYKNNPLRFIPQNILKSGNQGILRYLSQLKDCATEWKRMKLLVVGEENVGKTSLIRCFRSKPITMNVSTNGLIFNLVNLIIELLLVFGFGGQSKFLIYFINF